MAARLAAESFFQGVSLLQTDRYGGVSLNIIFGTMRVALSTNEGSNAILHRVSPRTSNRIEAQHRPLFSNG